jgi:hypothetical protein
MEQWMIVTAVIVVVTLLIVTHSLMRMVAPANEFEQTLDDRDQMDYLDNLPKRP